MSRLRQTVLLVLLAASAMLLVLGARLHWAMPPRVSTTDDHDVHNEEEDDVWRNAVPLDQLPNRLHLPKEAVERQDERFTCDNMSLLQLVDAAPFAHGWNKEAWRATWPANLNKMYTVKRRYLSRAKDKAALERRRAYGLEVLRRESEVLSKLKHWNIATFYGGCLAPTGGSDADVAIVLEYVDAYAMKELTAQTLPWCVWTKLALDLGALIKYLDEAESGPAVHCDWKPEQFVVRKKDYRVVLVDVDSIQFYKRGSAFLADAPCNGSAANECAELEGECFQELARTTPVPDAQCDTARGLCRGFNTSSMVWVLARGMLVDFLNGGKDLFVNEKGPSPDMVRGTSMFRSVFAALLRNTTQSERSARWSVEAVLKELRLLYAQGNGKQCMTKWQWHRRKA